jgi:hypothetical protein
MHLPVPRLARNPISFGGALLVTISALLFLFVYLLELFGMHTNPYIGMVFFLVLPGLFVGGLLLIPLGMYREHRARLSGAPRGPIWPRVDLNDPRHRTITAIVAVLTVVNVFIVGLAAFRGLHYMDSVEFCGQVCHEVMQPQFASYSAGPHARVACVECHIGPGAPWFVRSKLSGARQLYAVAFDTHSRPIPSPVHNLRPARDTCEQCHWPDKFHGDRLRAFREYASDEENSESITLMRIHVGGGSESLGPVAGIHWHTAMANRIEYIATDETRNTIPWVRLTRPDGTSVDYVVEGVSDEALAAGERRLMDCVDCHNRPSHTFEPSAARAVDHAIARGAIAHDLPYVRREAIAVLEREFPDQPTALEQIASSLRAFYTREYPEVAAERSPALEAAIGAVQGLYSRNVFPSMQVTWGTYTNQIGHMDAPGCFRCHDDSHTAPDGSVIRQDCEFCHRQEELAPTPTLASAR